MREMNKTGMTEFIQYAIDKGLVNTNTGGGWRSACNKILEDFGPDDDLTSIDVPSEVLRYNNRHPGVLSPDSLNQYQKRVQYVMSEFGKYLANPTAYKGVATKPSNGKPQERKRAAPVPAADAGSPPLSPPDHAVQAKHITSAVTETSLMMPFPLRPTFLAQVLIPRDLSKDEAVRLCTFIQALAHDPVPAS